MTQITIPYVFSHIQIPWWDEYINSYKSSAIDFLLSTISSWNLELTCNKTNKELIFTKNNKCSSCPTKMGKNNCHIIISFIIYKKDNDFGKMKKRRYTRHGMNKIQRLGASLGLSQYWFLYPCSLYHNMIHTVINFQ